MSKQMSEKEFEQRYGRGLPDPGSPRYNMLLKLAEIDKDNKKR